MAEIKKYEITLSELQADGATCKGTPEVNWETPFCADINCYLNADKTKLKIEVGPDCDDPCLYVTIDCPDECVDCRTRQKICLCNSNADCDACSDCSEDNICISDCLADEFCEDGQCKECSDSIPCPNGKVCVGGECQCPDEQFENDKGECVPCLPGTCPPCYICTPTGCKPRDCGDKVCDPTLDDCVDCVGSADCGKNEVCENNDCVCKEGYTRGPNGDCIPERECLNDDGCPDCSECDKFGRCQPRECEDGQICIDDDCVTPCENGADCPAGYGCDGEKCVKCSEADCTTGECAQLLGCECNSENNCVDSEKCDNSKCVTHNDCGEDCTCYKGRCVSCNNFPCNDCDMPGCACNSQGECDGIAELCTDSVTITKDDANCDLIGEASIAESCTCSPITFTFRPVVARSGGEIDFMASLRKGSATSFPEALNLNTLDNTSAINIADNEVPTSGTFSFKVLLDLAEIDINDNYTGQFVDNYEHYSQVIDFANEAQNDDVAGVQMVKKGNEYTDTNDIRYEISRVKIEIRETSDIVIPGSGCDYTMSLPVTSFEFTKGMYDDIITAGSNVNHPAYDVFDKYATLTSDQTRNPFFTWYRIKPTQNSFNLSDPNQAISKMYVAGSGGTYTDILEDYEDGLYNGYKYALHVDCPCKDNFKAYGQVKFCSPDEITGTFSNCATEFKPDSINPCDVNKVVPNVTDAQVSFRLLFNGNAPSNITNNVFSYNPTGLLVNSNGDSFTSTFKNGTTPIEKVTLEVFTPLVPNICTLELSGPDVAQRDIEYDVVCATREIQVKKTAVPSGNVTKLKLLSGNGSIDDSNPSYYSITGGDGAYEVEATFDNGCIKTITIKEDLCDQCFDITDLTVDFDLGDESGDFSISIEGGVGPYDYRIYKGNIISQGAPVKSVLNQSSTDIDITVPFTETGSVNYIVSVTDSNGCETTEEITVNNLPISNTLSFTNDTACYNQEGEIAIESIPAHMDGWKVTYDKVVGNGSPTPSSVTLSPTREVFTTSNVTSEIKYIWKELRRPDNSVAVANLNATSTITVVTELSLSTFKVDPDFTTTCNDQPNSQPKLYVKGTAGATLYYNDGIANKTFPLTGNDDYITLPNYTPGSYNLSSSKLVLDGCESIVTKTDTLTVQPTPQAAHEWITCSPADKVTLRFYIKETPNSSSQIQYRINQDPQLPANDPYMPVSGSFVDSTNVNYPVGSGWKQIDVHIFSSNNVGHEVDIKYRPNGINASDDDCKIDLEELTVPPCLIEQFIFNLATTETTNCCAGQSDAVVRVDGLQVTDPNGNTQTIGSGDYSVEFFHNGTSVGTALETFSISYGQSFPAGDTISLVPTVTITSGTLSGITGDAANVNIFVNDTDIDILGAPSTATWGEVISMTAGNSTFSNYEWKVDGVTAQNGASDSFDWTVPSSNATYTISLEATGGSTTCTKTGSVNIEVSLTCGESSNVTSSVTSCDYTAKHSPETNYPTIQKADDNDIYVEMDVIIEDCNNDIIETDSDIEVVAYTVNDARTTVSVSNITRGATFTNITLKRDDGLGGLTNEVVPVGDTIDYTPNTAQTIEDTIQAYMDGNSGSGSNVYVTVVEDPLNSGKAKLTVETEIVNSPSVVHLGVNPSDVAISIDGSNATLSGAGRFINGATPTINLTGTANISCDASWAYDVVLNNNTSKTMFNFSNTTFNSIAVVSSLSQNKFSTQSNDVRTCDSTTLTLSVDPCNGTGTYQWQSETSNGAGDWSDVVGETSTSIDIGTDNPNLYRVVATCSNGCEYDVYG